MSEFGFRTLDDVSVKDEVVLVRVDYNVPLVEEDGKMVVASDLRIRASLPTVECLISKGAKKIILVSHLGRPEGRDKKLSLRPVAERLTELMSGRPVEFIDEVTGPEVEMAIQSTPKGSVVLLENLRFEAGEKANSRSFAEELVASTGATLFVLDGFGVAHRATATTVAITELLPSVAGRLVEKEVAGLARVMENPERPFVVIIGGAKVEDKEPLIEKFAGMADKVLVGGKIAAEGYKGSSGEGGDVSAGAGADVYVAEDFDEDGEGAKLDIGPVATAEFVKALEGARTVLWSGVLGKVEDAAFATASEIVAKCLGERPEITSVICGGDTAGFMEELCEKSPELKYTLVSTGGGAALEFLVGKKLAGLEALEHS